MIYGEDKNCDYGILQEYEIDKKKSVILGKKEIFPNGSILDLPPSSRCVVFSKFDEVYKENFNSYIAAASLPDQVRNNHLISF